LPDLARACGGGARWLDEPDAALHNGAMSGDRVSIPSLTESARHLAERMAGLVGNAEQRRGGVTDALGRIAAVLQQVADAANSVAPASARILLDDDLRRMNEQRGNGDSIALVLGRGHTVAGLLKFESTPDGYIEASAKTWRSRTSPAPTALGRHDPGDDEAHNREIQRFLEIVDREMGGGDPPAEG
jgi:hypothetical protein